MNTLANDYFSELREAWRAKAAPRAAYRMMNRTFLRCVNELTSESGLRFGGPFAKTDFLLKEHHAPRWLHHDVNDARARLRRYSSAQADVLAGHLTYDFKALCQLVELVCQTPVPADLAALFPAARRRQTVRVKAECLRVVVNGWDDTHIFAYADEAQVGEVTVFYGGTSGQAVYKDWDWSYLKPLLREGSQLNLVRPREHQGVLYAELIIWEPDYLVDISAIANCFEEYSQSPLLHLLGKLKPAPNSEAIVLGNLASQFLDESLYDYSSGSTYAESVRRFFPAHAVGLLTAGLQPDFHDKARRQQHIINRVLHSQLPGLLGNDGIRFDASDVMVEPSFFSEMLGLQGRMDFLQLGQRVLIEQKAGKAAFPETDPPRQQEKHYVQLLLYMLLIRYNFRSTYEKNNRELHAFLLYSKYQNGLLPLSFSPALMFAALRLRNQIAAAEYAYSREGLSLLATLTADQLKSVAVQSTLWNRFKRAETDALLAPIRAASPLERAYYLRFLAFLHAEHLMAKVGSQTKENSGFADKWYSSLEDKLLAGNIVCDLELDSPGAHDAGRVDHVRLTRRPTAGSEPAATNFRVGDIVIFYPYDESDEPDARHTMVFRATIGQVHADHLVLNLRHAQVDARIFWHAGPRRWAVEHDFYESSFAPLYRGMHAFLSAPQQRRDLLLLQRRPRVDESLTLRGDYGAFNTLALRVRQAQDLFLIIGPPGTGKTSFGLLNSLREELLTPGSSVLLLSYTNRAIDEICAKLMEQNIDFIRVGGRFSCDERCRPYLLDTKVEHCSNLGQLRRVLCAARVYVGTTSAFNANMSLFRLKQFDLAIIDEASQILEPHLAGLLSATTPQGDCAIGKVVLIGDHKQLPAVVQQKEADSAVADAQLRDIHLTNCRLSLFERLLSRYRHDPATTYMLTRQGRMHADIARFSSLAFYQGLLKEVPLDHQRQPLPAVGRGRDAIEDLLLTRRVAFVNVEQTRPRPSDKVNTNEARAIAATLARVYEVEKARFSSLQTVGVIVPYRNQIAEVRRHVERLDIPALRHITVDTVERFQGSQRDYIIYGFTVQKSYQLGFLANNVFEEDGQLIDRKLNVAMTRARRHLLLLGCADVLAPNVVFSRLMRFVRTMGGYVDVALADYLAGHFALPAADGSGSASSAGPS